jgi:putative serine protease PepD
MTEDTRTRPLFGPYDDSPQHDEHASSDPWAPATPPTTPATPAAAATGAARTDGTDRIDYPAYGSPAPAGPGYSPLPPAPSTSPEPGRRRGATTLVAIALAAGLLGGGVGASITAATDDNGGSNVLSSLNAPAQAGSAKATAVEQVAAKLLPSVVSIEESAADGSGGEGTGVILSSDGQILTNNHVVAGAASGGSLTVTFNDGKSVDATIVGRDEKTDLAVIQAKGVSGLTPATLGDSSSLQPGEAVVAIGSPLGLQGTVTSGIVSALDRPVRTGDANAADSANTVIDAIQTDAAINPGNSGGPLVNLDGQVVGINSAIASLGAAAGGQSGSIGLGFSIPIDQARRIAKQLVDTGTASHAQLGVSVRDTTGNEGDGSSGAYLASVNGGSAAGDAGLQVGDVVTKVGARRIDSADALIAAIRSYQVGDKVTLTYVRNGRTDQATVTLGSDSPST